MYIMGPSKESLNLKTSFTYKDLNCSLFIKGDEALHSEELPVKKAFFFRGRGLEIITSNETSKYNLKLLVEEKKFEYLLKLLRCIANRCIRGIRNFGMISNIQEIKPEDEENTEKILRKWCVETSANGKDWESIFAEQEKFNLWDMLYGSEAQEATELDVALWPGIEEAIQDDLTPPPEKEFTTNAIEHLRLKNFRLALIESIIGLEIVLTRYIQNYLSTYKRIPKERIKNFLKPELGLNARISAVLDLTLDPIVCFLCYLQKILTAISWRNKVIHERGHIPNGIEEHFLRKCISEVLQLAISLGYYSEEIQAFPQLDNIANNIKSKHNLKLKPTIKLLGNHRISVTFQSIDPSEKFSKTDLLNEIVKDLVQHLSSRDDRFIAEKHLAVEFRYLDQPKARWMAGNWILKE
ncbi:MAG: hypothetical protein M1536_00375 [Firmicutes bacterium]|nr:hypothetical protein [Bacillota bacterium]